jgi:hypothetical protein
LPFLSASFSSSHLSRCGSTASIFIRFPQPSGHSIRPSSLGFSGSKLPSSSESSTSIGSCCELCDATVRLLLLRVVLPPVSASAISSESSTVRFRFAGFFSLLASSRSLLAIFKASGRAAKNVDTTSCSCQLLRSLLAWSDARQAGQRPSADSDVRMHREQNVCEHDVIMGVS